MSVDLVSHIRNFFIILKLYFISAYDWVTQSVAIKHFLVTKAVPYSDYTPNITFSVLRDLQFSRTIILAHVDFFETKRSSLSVDLHLFPISNWYFLKVFTQNDELRTSPNFKISILYFLNFNSAIFCLESCTFLMLISETLGWSQQ